jgi:hypothetical protein
MRIFPYRGESPPKKLVRILFWEEVKILLGPDFYTCNFLVIPSQYAGDVATLAAMGVALHNIYGTDIDKHAIAAAKERYPAANFAHCPFWEAHKAFPQLGRDIGCAFIDLCSPLRSGTIEQVFSLGQRVQLMGFEFMCGREAGLLNQALDLGSSNEPPQVPRLRYLQSIKHGGSYFNIETSWCYKSHSSAHFGKSMALGLGTFHRRKRINLEFTDVVATWETVRSTCIKNPSYAPLWNVSAGTLAAWRAHETRGTYLKK